MSVDGTWNITLQTPLGSREARLTLSSSGGTLTGTLAADIGSTEIAAGTVEGDQASWTADVTDPMALTLEFSARVEGDMMSGSVRLGMFGTAPLSGTRA